MRCRAAEALVAACEQGLGQCARVGEVRTTDDFDLAGFGLAYVFGLPPVSEAIERVEALDAASGNSILLEARCEDDTRQAAMR